MKKAKHVTFQMPVNSELSPFKPLYLLSNVSLDPAKQIYIFISSSEKNCYIHEKGHWQKLVIDDLLLGHISKTYCFSFNHYRYLYIAYQDNLETYLTSTKKSKAKTILKNIELSEEILHELAFPNLEQLDISAIVKTKKEAEKILQLKARIAEIITHRNNLHTSLLIFNEAKAAMKKLECDKKDPFTVDDIDTQIKLLNRQIHHYEYVKLKNEVKIERLLAQQSSLNSESFERSLLELRLQKKETNQVIQNQKLAINALEKMPAEFSKILIKPSEDPVLMECIKQKIQLLREKVSENKLQLENVEKKVQELKEGQSGQNPFVVTSQAKQLFFNTKSKATDVKKIVEERFKNLTF